MSPEILVLLGQFGAAGLIGILWILERRYAALRNRQLAEAHQRLMESERDSVVLLEVVKDNTRAVAALEAGQRQLIDMLRTLAAVESGWRRRCEESE